MGRLRQHPLRLQRQRQQQLQLQRQRYIDTDDLRPHRGMPDAKAASHTAASTVRSALAHVSSGTRDQLASPRFLHCGSARFFTDIVFEEADPP